MSKGRSREASDDSVAGLVCDECGDVTDGEDACDVGTHKTPCVVVVEHSHEFR